MKKSKTNTTMPTVISLGIKSKMIQLATFLDRLSK
jgi:hypothetical protein